MMPYRKDNPKYKEMMKRYRQSPDNKEKRKVWCAENREKMRGYRKKNQEKYPEKQQARMAVSGAIVAGKMPRATEQSCAHCGNPACHHHHHNGYDRDHWLDVVPV